MKSHVVGIDRSKTLREEPNVGHNRWHPDIPPVITVRPGELVTLETRDALDGEISESTTLEDFSKFDWFRVHPLTGPVYIEGAQPGDLLEVEIVEVIPQSYGYAIQYHTFGMLKEYSPGPFLAHFDLADGFAVSKQIPGVRFRAAPFMGTMGVAPDAKLVQESLRYESRIPGWVPSSGKDCIPATETIAKFGLRTLPPRYNAGNLDCRQLIAGSSMFVPVYVPGALFSCGDAHFVQGESECVTGLEMAATGVFRFHLHKGLAEKQKIRDAQFKFSERNKSGNYYATTGQSFGYGDAVIHDDITPAAQNALLNMIAHLGHTRGYDFNQAYVICSLGADLRISQAVNVPNYTASCILDLSIFD